MLKEDFETMTRFAYPKVVELYGGREKMIDILASGKDFAKKQGLIYESISIGTPSKPVRVGDELQCLIPRIFILRGPKGKFKLDTHSIGVSQDDGKNWFFIDTSNNMTREKIKVFFPNLSNEIVIPTEKLPEKIGD